VVFEQDAALATEGGEPVLADAVVPFHGAHQAGIATPAQDRLHFAAFDVTTTDAAALASMLSAWTAAAARMTQGLAAGPGGAIPIVPQATAGH
jgi:deferrochelatase/peroxidase EfeB